MPTSDSWVSPLQEYADALQAKFSALTSGEPEDQLRAPFERLLTEGGKVLGIAVLPIGETLLGGGVGKPDFGIECDGLLSGHLELKAPGKGADTSRFTGHDRRQWQRFSDLPNLLYSDGQEFALYRKGQLERKVRLDGSPITLGRAAITESNARELESLFLAYFRWEPEVPKTSRQLAQFLAPLCRMLRDDVLNALRADITAVKAAASDWQRYLFPGADNERFADSYAQTVTFSLLLARSNGSDTLFIDKAVESLTHANTLLSRALKVLTDPLVQEHLSTSLGMLQRVIDRVPSGTMSGGRRDPWLHFYEDFLAEYDPQLRKDAGAYYTPVEVVQGQVRLVDDLLRKKLNKRHGFATGGVNVLDPAVGTGTYLLGVVEHVMEEVRKTEGQGAMPARADLLGSHLYGFEIMVGPYAVAALRMTRMLQQYGGHAPADGVQIMLNNTLESPYEKIPELPLLYQPIGLEHKRAKRVKESVPVIVCLGNPPYDRHAASTLDNRSMTGGWVRWGETQDGRDSILQDFIEPVKAAGKGGSLKNLYNLYVYFWRWALWKTFEHDLAYGPGVVTYITASSFLDGDAFLGMRQHIRKTCDEVWIIDLGGEGRGTRRDENVFAIQTPVAITIAVRYGGPQPDTPAKVSYARIDGTRAEKLHIMESLSGLDDLEFSECPREWTSPFRPGGKGTFFEWPLLTDLMPWRTSGVQFKRNWPIAPDQKTLTMRWISFLKTPDRSAAFKETRDRKVSKGVLSIDGTEQLSPLKDIPENEPHKPVIRYGFRSFDRHYILHDNRLCDYIRPALWHSHSPSQIYFTSSFTQPLGSGPAITVSADVPDMHYYSGRGAKDTLPLYRDAKAKIPNFHPELLSALSNCYGEEISPEEVASYIFAILSSPEYVNRHHQDLTTMDIRVPLTKNKKLFDKASSIGAELLFLHTYGERLTSGRAWPSPIVMNLKPVDGSRLPESYSFDESRQVLIVGDGEFGPVSKQVYEFDVSGFKVVQSWLGYRLRNRRGKKTSPLDNISPEGWSAAYTSELLNLLNILTKTTEFRHAQKVVMEEILESPLFSENEFGVVPDAARNSRSKPGSQLDL